MFSIKLRRVSFFHTQTGEYLRRVVTS